MVKFCTVNRFGLQIYIPYKIGCANAGGDWDIVEDIINVAITKPVICKL